jgi:hypothetical protein
MLQTWGGLPPLRLGREAEAEWEVGGVGEMTVPAEKW